LSTAPETGRTTPRSRNGTLDAQIAGADIEPVAAPAPSSTFKSPMSSFGHRLGRLDLDDLNFDRRGYNRWRTYFQSKLANMLFTAEKHRRLTVASSGTKALAAHPGATATDLGHEGGGFTNKVIKPAAPFMQSAASGVLPFVRAATDPMPKAASSTVRVGCSVGSHTSRPRAVRLATPPTLTTCGHALRN